MRQLSLSLLLCLALALPAAPQQQTPAPPVVPNAPATPATPNAPKALDWSVLETTLGRVPSEQQGVRRVTVCRTDAPVFVGLTRVAPAALCSWMAFREVPHGVVADGELVLLSRQLSGVMDTLLQHGFEITALDQNLVRERPPLIFLSFFARGDLAAISQGLKAALDVAHPPAPDPKPWTIAATYDRGEIQNLMGAPGTLNGPVLQFVFPRLEPVTAHGISITPAMGVASEINFQPARNGAAVLGSFCAAGRRSHPGDFRTAPARHSNHRHPRSPDGREPAPDVRTFLGRRQRRATGPRSPRRAEPVALRRRSGCGFQFPIGNWRFQISGQGLRFRGAPTRAAH